MDHAQSFPSFTTPAERLSIATRCAGAVRFNDIEPASIRWLWPGRIPLGYVTLLVSDPGAGKSLVSLDIAARVSTGRPWPDEMAKGRRERENGEPTTDLSSDLPISAFPTQTSPASVLLLNVEDHFTTTIRPRLEALGADCSRILGMSHVPGEGVLSMPRPVAIDRDINRLEILLREIGDCRLMILDPITAFFGDTASRSSGNVWKVLSSLSWLAASANLAVLAVTHLRKKEGVPLHRAIGSLAFMAAARTAWTIAPDPADPHRRLFLPLKNNLAETAGGLTFTIESSTSGGAPVVRWLSDVIDARPSADSPTPRQPWRPDDERRYAVQWLSAELMNRQTPVRQIRQAAEAHGITWGTLRRAYREVGAEAVFHREGNSIRWDWKLSPINQPADASPPFLSPSVIEAQK